MADTLRILLVDSDPRESEQISSRLSGARHRVVAASGLQEACEFLEIQRFDAVLLASSLDGAATEFTAKLRALDAGQRSAARTPILSLAAAETCDPPHADGYLPASFDPAALAEAVAGLAHAVSALGQPQPGSDLPIFDFERLNAQAGNDRELVGEIVALFLADQQNQFVQMREALEAGDYSGLSAVAHSIKGSFGTLGAMVCWSRAQQLEYAAKQCDGRGCRELLLSLENALRGLLPHLEALRPI
ncbi:MAG TPA: Hpt domain-containing protein [Bryobacteraceae bacterium]